MLKAGSCAAEQHELGQVRKEAALSETFRVLQGHLAGVGGRCRRRPPYLDGGVTITFVSGCRIDRRGNRRFAKSGSVDKTEETGPPHLF